METILFLAHTEADGSLAKPALEAVRPPKAACPLPPARHWSSDWSANSPSRPPTRSPACGAADSWRVTGPEFAQARYATDAAAAEALLPSRPGHRGDRAGHLPLATASCPAWPSDCGGRVDTHVTGTRGQQRRHRGHPLVLPPAHGSRATPHTPSLGHPG